MLLCFIDQKRSFGRPQLLTVVVALCLLSGCGFFEGKSEYQQMLDKRSDFSEYVADLGGTAVMESRSMNGMDGIGWFIDLSGTAIDDDVLEEMGEIVKEKPIYELNLSNTSFNDEQLSKLDKAEVLEKMFFLDLSNTQVTDAGLDGISNFYVIHELKVKGTQVSQAAVKRLGDKQLAKPYVPDKLRTRPKTDI